MHYLKVAKFRKVALSLRLWAGRDGGSAVVVGVVQGHVKVLLEMTGSNFLLPGCSISRALDSLGLTDSGNVFVSKGFN